jgi:predicted XRE-type DNA-binding protein
VKSKKRAKRAFPDDKTLDRVRKKLSAKSYSGGNLALPEGASEVERAKYQICQMIAKYQRENEIMQKDLAKKLGVHEARVSQILRGRIATFTLDRLITYAARLYPGFKLEIRAA